MPLMFSCRYCGAFLPRLMEWRKGKVRVYVCGAHRCEKKAEQAGFERRGMVRP